jgi:hypothetical protein
MAMLKVVARSFVHSPTLQPFGIIEEVVVKKKFFEYV